MVGHTCAQFPWETNISDAPDGDGDDDDDEDNNNGEDNDGYVRIYVPYNKSWARIVPMRVEGSADEFNLWHRRVICSDPICKPLKNAFNQWEMRNICNPLEFQ